MNIKFRHNSGFSMVEVVIALAIAAFSLVAIFGLLPVGINSNASAIRQTTAASFARAIVSDLRATPVTSGTTATSAIYHIPIPAAGSSTNLASTIFLTDYGTVAQSGTNTVVNQDADPTQNPQFRATVTFAPPGTTTTRGPTNVQLFLTWPAMGDQKVATAPSHYTGSYETFTALDRN